MLKKYADILSWDTVADKPENVRFEGVDYARIEMPVQAGFEIQMQDAGFYLADRTVKVSINLAKLPTGLEKFIRLPIEETNKYKKEIFELAVNSFLYDRRFHILPECSQEISAKVLKTWIDEQDNALVCLYKDKPIGFLELKETSTDTIFVHLAAVEEKYRLTGAAMALYAKACLFSKERGYKKLEGRISSQNTAVMNIYAAFGAAFSEPRDIYLKKVK